MNPSVLGPPDQVDEMSTFVTADAHNTDHVFHGITSTPRHSHERRPGRTLYSCGGLGKYDVLSQMEVGRLTLFVLVQEAMYIYFNNDLLTRRDRQIARTLAERKGVIEVD